MSEISLFSEQIDMIEGGALDRDLGRSVSELLQSVMSIRAMGKITLTLKFKPQGTDQVLIDADINKEPPKLKRPSSIAWVDGKFQLTDTDPVQASLEFADQRDASAPPTVVIDNTSKRGNQ